MTGRLGLILGLSALLAACHGPAAKTSTLHSGEPMQELKITDLVLGDGAEAKAGKLVIVHYTGWLEDGGKKFDSSLDRDEPFSFMLGEGEVIQGWDVGVVGMKVGGKRKLHIPPHMGYGDRGAGGVIPGKAALVFDVELLGVE
jgi:FKBP-type peptidyl-prolyl cis-trans isomerase